MTSIMGHAGMLLNQYDADALELFTRFADPPSGTIRDKINTAIVTLKDESIWDLLDSLYIPAGAGEQQGGLCDWKRSTKSATLAGGAVWSNTLGFDGDGIAGSYVNLDYIPSTDGVNFTLHNSTAGGLITAASAQASCDYWGGNSTANNLTRFQRASSTTHYGTMSTATGSSAFDGSTLNVLNKFISVRRKGSGTNTSCYLYDSGAAIGTADTADANSLSGATIYALARNNNGTPTGESTGALAAWYAGGDLSDAQITALHSVITTYLT